MKAKMKPHKLLSLLLALVMVAGMLPAMGQVAYAYSEGDIEGTTGTGTKTDPIIVDNFKELKAALGLEGELYIIVNNFTTNVTASTGNETVIYAPDDYIDGDYAIYSKGKKVLTVNTTINVAPGSINAGLYGFINVLGTLEINGTGTISCGFNSVCHNAVFEVNYPGQLIVNDGITIKGGYGGGYDKYRGVAILNYSGTVTINGGVFWGNGGIATESSTSAFSNYAGNTTINGGTFNVTSNSSAGLFGLLVEKDSKITLSGGTYQGIRVPSGKTIADLLATDSYYYYTNSGGKFAETNVTQTTEELTVKTKRIDSVDVNITAPVVGNTPQDASSNTENAKVLSTVWSSDGAVIPETGTFEAGKTYKVQVSVYTKNDYFFGDPLTVTINGSTAVTDFERPGVGNRTITFEKEYTPGNSILNSVDVSITEPVAGAKPQNGVSRTDNTYVSITEWWHNGYPIASTDTFVAGETYKVHVIVNPDSGYEFADNPTATFNGSKTGTLYANGKDYINYYAEFTTTAESTEYAITVTNGKATVGAGTEISKAAEGTTVTLTANAASDGEIFDKWVVEDGSASITLADATSETTTFTMPAGAVSVKATYCNYISINLVAGGGSGAMEPLILKNVSGAYELSVPECTFTPPANKVFDKWMWSKDGTYLTPGETKTLWSSSNGTTLTAIWKDAPVTEYDITVTDGKATVGAGTEISKAAEGTIITLTANAAPSGQVFDKWVVVSGSITLADASSATTTFTMPAEEVSVKATYKAAPHTHSYGSDWKSDADKHWHECSCGYKSGEAAHTASDWITDTAATATTDGTKHKECTDCGYEMETGTIPATGSDSSGIIIFTYSTLTFDTNGGSSISKITKIKGTTVDLEKYEPTKEGYEFTGWYSDKELTDEITSIKLTNNTTVYAGWEAIKENPSTGAFPFVDVDTDDWFFEDVAYVYDNGLMNGVGDNLFAPEISTDRAMIVTILWRMEGCPVVNYAMNFTDVQEDQWYTEAIRWAEATGIVNGYGNGLFGTTDPITLEQAAAILYRYAAYKGWTDDTTVPILPAYTYSEWAENDVIWAELSGIFSGVGTELDDLTTAASRAEIASFLHRFCEDIAK